MKPSNHTNYYGLVFGGQRARRPVADLHVFPGRAGRPFLIKQRNGEQTSDVQRDGKNAAIKMPDNTGKSVNVLEVRVAGDTISYVVNGTVVHTTPKSGATRRPTASSASASITSPK